MKGLSATVIFLGFLAQSENPNYDRWSSFKAGSWVKTTIEAELNGNRIVEERTTTLLNLDKEKVVVELKRVMKVGDKEQPTETIQKEIPSGYWPNPGQIQSQGDEEIDIAGKKLKCHWVEGPHNVGKIKFWTSPEVPGGIVKGDQWGSDGAHLRFVVTAWEKK